MAKESSEKYTLQRTGVSEQIFNILKSQIASGKWKPGMKISSENEIAAQFSVSRMSARNALQRLCAMGLLETRSGEGTFVKEFKLADYFREVAELLNDQKSLSGIREFRRFFERDYLILACQRRTEEDIKDLRRLHQRMVELSAGDDFDAFFEIDMQFHHRICEMTGNEVFLMVEKILHDLLVTQLKGNTMYYAEMKEASMDKAQDDYVLKILVSEHMDFIEALEQRDPRRVTDRMKDYFSYYDDIQER